MKCPNCGAMPKKAGNCEYCGCIMDYQGPTIIQLQRSTDVRKIVEERKNFSRVLAGEARFALTIQKNKFDRILLTGVTA